MKTPVIMRYLRKPDDARKGWKPVKYWIIAAIMLRGSLLWFSEPRVEGGALNCGPLGSIFVVLLSGHWNRAEIHHPTDRRYLETEDFFCQSQRQLYYYVSLQSHTMKYQYLYLCRERREEEKGRRRIMKHIWCKNSVLAWSLLLSWAPWLHNTSIFVAGRLIHSWDTMPTMCDNYPCPAFPAFRSNHQNHQRWGEGEGGGWKSILFIDANDDWEISTDARRSDFTQQKNKSPLSRQRRSN